MWVQLLAGVALFLGLLWSFGFAMSLRQAGLERERAKDMERARGRRVVAELPGDDGSVSLFLADDVGFYWDSASLTRDAVVGARLLLNGAEVASFVRPGSELPPPERPEEFEGRERWEVRAFAKSGSAVVIACGRLREGVSREAASAVFEALRSATA